MESCIYEGQVRHTRRTPVQHSFRYRMFMMYLDLDELPTLFRKRWLWSAGGPAVARFRRSDHVGPSGQSLSETLRDLVERETGRRPGGPIRLLTNLSYYGYCFNPVSFYYVYRRDGRSLEAIVAEVNNTPWGERDTYVLPVPNADATSGVLRYRPLKKMHVSPFMPMTVEYDWCFGVPDRDLTVFMANDRDGERVFSASMRLRRTEISGASLARVLIAYPFMTLKVIAAIYWQAFRLWLKRSPYHEHPDKNKTLVAR